MKEKAKKLLPLFDGALISAAILLAVFAVKHIWPFGTNNITYDDMAQGTLPIYYHIYDWLHGDSSLLFDWFTGLGVNVSNSCTPTPLDLLLYFFKRENLIYAIGALLVARTAAAAFTARLSFENMFPKAPSAWKTLFSVSYALCGYAMFYYTNLFWLDFVIMFPLLLWGLKRLLDESKPWLYIVSYAVSLILSFYQGFMVTLAVFAMSGLYVLLILDKNKRAQRTFLLGLSTVTGGLLSAWRLVPTALQTLSSKRLETSISDADKQGGLLNKVLNSTTYANIPQKLILLIGLELAFVFTAILLYRLLKRKEYKRCIFVFGGVFLMFAQVAFENVNLFWHGGSYIQFPMRFFFTSVFVLLCIALAGIEKYGDVFGSKKSTFAKVLYVVLSVVFTAGFLLSILYFAKNNCSTLGGTSSQSQVRFIAFCGIYITGMPMFFFVLSSKKRFARALCTVLTVAECFCVAYAGVANSHRKEEQDIKYNSDSYVDYCNEVELLDTDCGSFGRIKNPDTSLNTNYPFLTRTPALSNWTHYIPYNLQKSAAALGCGTQYTRLLDSGGTAFTDALFNIKKAVARNTFALSQQYSVIDRSQEFSVYQNDYAVEFGLLADSELLKDATVGTVAQRFELQNWLYTMFSGDKEDLFEFCTLSGDYSDKIEIADETTSRVVFKYTAGSNEELYLNADGFSTNETMKIYVNGERVAAPYYKHTAYSYYPSSSVNGMLDLGTFNRGETVEVLAECINGGSLKGKTVQLGCMSLNKITKLDALYASVVSNEKAEKSHLTFDYNNPTADEKYLFVPVSYDKGWSCKINGESAEVYKALGAYIAVKLPAGAGSVELKFSPDAQPLGIGLTFIGMLLVIALLIMKKHGYACPKLVGNASLWLFTFIFLGFILLVYLVPIGYYFKGFRAV